MSNTTFNGDIAELMAASELVQRGYVVSRPLTNGAPYDLLVDMGDGIKRIQIKKAGRTTTGAMRFMLSASKSHRGRKSVSYFGLVDFVIAVDCERKAFYVICGDDLLRPEISVRIDAPKNNQQTGVRLAASYAIDKYFPVRSK